MKNKYLLGIVCLCMALNSLCCLAQLSEQERLRVFEEKEELCGQWPTIQKLYQAHPELRPENNKAHQELEQFTQKFTRNNTKNDEVLSIPVVVHIIHQNGPENVSDQVVIDAINDLNLCFQSQNSNQSAIHSNFNSIVADVGFQFELAKFDPQGNPTTGITRTESAYTNAGDDPQMKIDTRWPRENYLNVWVCKSAFANSNSSGLSFLPADVSSSTWAHLDGVVMAYWAFGKHTNTSPGFEYVLAHEVGHWANLSHIWGSGNYGHRKNCNKDDGVSDTPNTKGNYSYSESWCGSTRNSCSSQDNLSNFMDYVVTCYAMFTEGQKSRMQAALHSNVSSRNNLWSANNLMATLGIDGNGDGGSTTPPDPEPVATCTDGIQNGDETGVDCGGTCPDACAPPPNTTCDVPSNLQTTPQMNGKRALLEWSAVSSATYYTVKYKKVSSSNWKTLVPENNSVIATGLRKGTEYEWEVQSNCGNTTSDWASGTFTAGYPSGGGADRLGETFEPNSIQIYPNPFKNHFVLNGLVPTEQLQTVNVSIYDLEGQLITKSILETDQTGQFKYMFDTSNFPVGQLLILVQSGYHSEAFKINKLR